MRLFFLLAALSITGCSDQLLTATGDDEESFAEDGAPSDIASEQGEAPPEGAEGEEGGFGGPPLCEVDSDCEADCPEDAIGCACVDDVFSDDQVCAPVCQTDDDCPPPPEGEAYCDGEGVCVPDEG